MSDFKLRILTLNCWGIPFISKHLKERMTAIGDVLLSGKYDLICMQEVWNNKDFLYLKKYLKHVLPYSHYFYSGVFGSGLCVFSKHVIHQVFFHHWPLNGYFHKVHHGDWFGGKGIGLCCLKIGDLKVNLYTAHLHAQYHETDEYCAHRIVQAVDAAQFIQLTSGFCDIIILGGDLNIEPDSLPYRIICGESCYLKDCFLISSNQISKDLEGTNESSRNSYSDPKSLLINSHGKRIDYILFRAKSNIQVNLVDYELPLPSRVPNREFSYSDHEAVSATIEFTLKTKATNSLNAEELEIINSETTLNEGLAVCNEALISLAKSRQYYTKWSVVLFVTLMTILSLSLPNEMNTVFKIIVVILSIGLCFTAFMSSLWNRIEVNAILSGKLSLEFTLSQLKFSESEADKM